MYVSAYIISPYPYLLNWLALFFHKLID
uniref:Uncharacterized protein n=1 Tax=Arundo donax TaxID=35708 RepID=A0A0A9CBM9_ARUDO